MREMKACMRYGTGTCTNGVVWSYGKGEEECFEMVWLHCDDEENEESVKKCSM